MNGKKQTDGKRGEIENRGSFPLQSGVKRDLIEYAKSRAGFDSIAYLEEYIRFMTELVNTVPSRDTEIITVRMPRKDGVVYFATKDDKSWRYLGGGKWESI